MATLNASKTAKNWQQLGNRLRRSAVNLKLQRLTLSDTRMILLLFLALIASNTLNSQGYGKNEESVKERSKTEALFDGYETRENQAILNRRILPKDTSRVKVIVDTCCWVK